MYGSFGDTEHLGRRTLFDEQPLVHHGDAIGEHVDDREVVTDEQGREAELALQLGEQFEHPRLHRHVECARRLVRDEQVGLERERPGEACALALPAAELVRVTLTVCLGQLHRLEQFVDALLRRGGILRPSMDDERLGDALRDREQRVEG